MAFHSEKISRRTFGKRCLGAVMSHAVLETLLTSDAVAKNIQPILLHWTQQLQEYCSDMKSDVISQVVWQQQTEALFRSLDLNELLKFIDFDQLTRNFNYPDLGVGTKYVKFPRLAGIPQKTIFIKKIFGLKKDRAIIPHGHSNMASAHLVLKGEFALKHYEKVEEEAKHLIIKPSLDHAITAGDCSSISDESQNVHWFIAKSQAAFTLDVIMLNLNEQAYDIHNLDIREGEQISGGLIRAPKLDVATALKKYGKESHH